MHSVTDTVRWSVVHFHMWAREIETKIGGKLTALNKLSSPLTHFDAT